jgi:hypothetical protein
MAKAKHQFVLKMRLLKMSALNFIFHKINERKQQVKAGGKHQN